MARLIENENIDYYPGYSFEEVFGEGEVVEEIDWSRYFLYLGLVIALAGAFFYILFDVDLPVVRF